MSGKYEYLDNGKYRIDRETGFREPNKNPCLKYVLVGITPGSNQLEESIDKSGLEFGSIEYKYSKAFDGTQMRKNIKKMFEFINDNKHVGILNDLINVYGGTNGDINKLFDYSENSIIEFTSLIKDALYVKNNKTGEFDMFKKPADINPRKNEQLYREFENGFLADYHNYYEDKGIIFIACGKYVFRFLKTVFGNNETLIAIVHPSPNARIHIDSFLNNGYDPEEEITK